MKQRLVLVGAFGGSERNGGRGIKVPTEGGHGGMGEIKI